LEANENTEIKTLKSKIATQEAQLKSMEREGSLWRAQRAAFEHRVEELEAQVSPLKEEVEKSHASVDAAKSVAVMLKTELRRLKRSYKEQEHLLMETEKNLGKLMAHPPQWLPPSWIAKLAEQNTPSNQQINGSAPTYVILPERSPMQCRRCYRKMLENYDLIASNTTNTNVSRGGRPSSAGRKTRGSSPSKTVSATYCENCQDEVNLDATLGTSYGDVGSGGGGGSRAPSPVRYASPYVDSRTTADINDSFPVNGGGGERGGASQRRGSSGNNRARPTTPPSHNSGIQKTLSQPVFQEALQQRVEIPARDVRDVRTRPKSAGSNGGAGGGGGGSSNLFKMRFGWRNKGVAVAAMDAFQLDVNPNNKTFVLPEEKVSSGRRKYYSHKNGGQYGPMPVFSTAARFAGRTYS